MSISGTSLWRNVVAFAVVLTACSEPKTFELDVPSQDETMYVDIRGRIAEGQPPTAVEESTFVTGDLPPTFVVHRGEYVPIFTVRQRAHAGWSGRADALYVRARVHSIFTPPSVVRVDELENAGIDPVALDLQRKLRAAIAQSPTWEEFFLPPIRRVLIVEQREDAEKFDLPGGTQVLTAPDASDWIDVAQSQFNDARLPIWVEPPRVTTRFAAPR